MNQNRSKKIILLFILLLLGFFIFLGTMFYSAMKPRHLPSTYTSISVKAKRGSIISADGFHIATTKKLYKAVVNTKNIDPKKKELFIQLFSIYSGMDQKVVRRHLNKRRGSVVLSYRIGPKHAQYLKTLSFELRRHKVFVEYITKSGRVILHGLNIIESGETREYPYGKLLTPIIGYPQKIEDDGYTKSAGIKGIEKFYNDELSARQDGKSYGHRDVNNYMILNNQSYTTMQKNGLDIQLNIPLTLQARIEKITDKYKKLLDAKEIFTVVMESKSGKILSVASSNRFLPKSIKRSDYPSLNTAAIEYSFEAGSVLKPIIFSLLLDKKLINPYDLVNCHNGRYKLGRKTITDEHKYDWLSAENIIVHSSNIGMAQLAQKLNAVEYYQGLVDFGLSKKSGIDLAYEKAGSIPSIAQLQDEIFKATASYGYGMTVNLMQIVKAYNSFNNNGRMQTPAIVNRLIDEHGIESKIDSAEAVQVISSATAKRMQKILIKTVNEGTGMKAITPGLTVGGKTGTAHIAYKGHYVRRYNTSFVGFANDDLHKYTIGVTVVEPKLNHFASQTAVPVFKGIVDILIEENYLEPNIIK